MTNQLAKPYPIYIMVSLLAPFKMTNPRLTHD